MKCKICGYSTRTLAAMAKHYRKTHPGSFRRRKTMPKIRRTVDKDPKYGYCPHCGRRIQVFSLE